MRFSLWGSNIQAETINTLCAVQFVSLLENTVRFHNIITMHSRKPLRHAPGKKNEFYLTKNKYICELFSTNLGFSIVYWSIELQCTFPEHIDYH